MGVTARYVLCACVAYGLFCNHWSRDSLGALEVPLETDEPYSLSVHTYNSLTSVYFLPNMCVPIIAGVIAQRYGAATTYASFFLLAACGNFFVAVSAGVGASGASGLIFLGRALMGVAYEAVDVLPVGILAPRFPDRWSTVVGALNGVNRFGSVLNFLLEPVFYEAGGLALALLVPSLVGASAFATALLAYNLDADLSRKEAASPTAPKEAPPALSRDSVRQIPLLFWLYLVGGACIYGAVVPFWFVGAKHLQSRFGMDLSAADALLLFPEGMIALVAPPFGLLIDRQQWSLSKRLTASALSLSLIPLCLLSLAWLPVAPALVSLVLGTGYAFAQVAGWASITLVAPPHLLNLCSGLNGTGFNILPTLIPLLLFTGNTSVDVTTLAVFGGVGVVAFLLAVRESDRQAVRRTSMLSPADGGGAVADAAHAMEEDAAAHWGGRRSR